MTEEFLYYLWRNRLLYPNLETTKGQKIVVLKTGEKNDNSGPDFLYARVKIDETEWAGNIEMHLKASDWYKHNHDKDHAYNNVVMHVVYQADKAVFYDNGDEIPVLELKNKFDEKLFENYQKLLNSSNKIPCEKSVASVSQLDKLFWLDRLMMERLEMKANQIEQELNSDNIGFQEVFYRKFAGSFGFKVNKEAFERLAVLLPLKILQKHADSLFSLEALLFGTAGMLERNFNDEYPQSLKREYNFLRQKYGLNSMSPVYWKFMRMRPGNFPTIRISQFAALIYKLGGQFQKIPGIKRLSDVLTLLDVSASEYWQNHYRFDVLSNKKNKPLGDFSRNILVINAVVPFVFVYGNLFGIDDYRQKSVDWLEKIKPENNKIVRLYKNLNFPVENAMHSQALIQLKRFYCDEKRCLNCALGQKIIRGV